MLPAKLRGGWLVGAGVLASVPRAVNPYYVIVSGYAIVFAIAASA